MKTNIIALLFIISILASSCLYDNLEPEPQDPDKAEKVAVDRFSTYAGTLFVRDASNGLPGPNEPIDFDVAPFITKGLGPHGEKVQYYNFDVQPEKAAPIYVLFREGESTPVEGQLNIIDVIPGSGAYNDFWRVNKVTVPAKYVANTVTDYIKILENKYPVEQTDIIVNCPVVPEGSTAIKRYNANESTALIKGWYKGKLVHYFTFDEKDLRLDNPSSTNPPVPESQIFVTFNININDPDGGPSSGFVTEPGTDQTHNVVQTIPTDATYSPFWLVNVYDNADFDAVSDWTSVTNATTLATGVALVNCPVVLVE